MDGLKEEYKNEGQIVAVQLKNNSLKIPVFLTNRKIMDFQGNIK
jgi:hypothetical protein